MRPRVELAGRRDEPLAAVPALFAVLREAEAGRDAERLFAADARFVVDPVDRRREGEAVFRELAAVFLAPPARFALALRAPVRDEAFVVEVDRLFAPLRAPLAEPDFALALLSGTATPAWRAFERPIATACFAFFTPCLPSRTWWTSSRTNSPAWVLGFLPWRFARCALA